MMQNGDNSLDQLSLAEAEFGNKARARDILDETSSRSAVAGIVGARTGDLAGAKSIADELAQRFPLGTVVQEIQLPMIRSAIELQRGHAASAVEALRPAVPYELRGFLILYLAGQAHLRSGATTEAAADFQKILDHRGISITSPIFPLAYIGLARARAATGEIISARKAYEQFFALWKDADPDISILREAKAEYAKLK